MLMIRSGILATWALYIYIFQKPCTVLCTRFALFLFPSAMLISSNFSISSPMLAFCLFAYLFFTATLMRTASCSLVCSSPMINYTNQILVYFLVGYILCLSNFSFVLLSFVIPYQVDVLHLSTFPHSVSRFFTFDNVLWRNESLILNATYLFFFFCLCLLGSWLRSHYQICHKAFTILYFLWRWQPLHLCF